MSDARGHADGAARHPVAQPAARRADRVKAAAAKGEGRKAARLEAVRTPCKPTALLTPNTVAHESAVN